jgi:ribosome-binding protein aMBF1 (putative translation factor)
MPGKNPVMKKQSRSSVSRKLRQTQCEAFAARIRAARAVLRWSQTELGKKAQITQRAIHRLEKAAVEARHPTQVRIDEAFKDAGIVFAELPNGGFELIVPGHVLTSGPQKTASQR